MNQKNGDLKANYTYAVDFALKIQDLATEKAFPNQAG